MATMNLFVEQVQVNLYIKFQVNRSLLKNSISFLPQGGAREKILYTKMQNLENIEIFASRDMHVKFDNFWNMMKASKGQHSLEKIITTLRKTIGSSTTKS